MININNTIKAVVDVIILFTYFLSQFQIFNIWLLNPVVVQAFFAYVQNKYIKLSNMQRQ